MDVFPEPGAPLPAALSRGTAGFTPAGEQPGPVHIAEGYAPFEAFVREHGEDPSVLAGDVSALWEFLSGRVAVLDDPVLMTATARFAGNVIAVEHPAATWRVVSEPEIGTSTRSIPVEGLVRTMVEHPERREALLEMLATWEQEDRDDAEYRTRSVATVVPTAVVPPMPFRRPLFPTAVFRDEAGRGIPYGRRWGGGEIPEEAYSRVTHPARFAPLAADVDALAEYLRTWYLADVDREETEEGVRRVTVRPTTGALVTMTVGADGVLVEAGALLAHTCPACSCDACDENAETAADDLERTVLTIAAGGFREIHPLGHRRWALTGLHHPDGTSSTSGGPSNRLDAEDLRRAEESLGRLVDGWWPAWTLR